MVPGHCGRRRLSLVAAGVLIAAAMACSGENMRPPAGPSETPRPSPGLTVDGDRGRRHRWCGRAGTTKPRSSSTACPALLLLAGDIAYPTGTMGDFQRCFEPQWGQFRSRWHPVPGNHDYMTASATAYFDYFGAAAGSDRSGYYVRSFGDWLVLMLDSNVPSQRNSPQWEFVRRELELHRRPCTLAVWHHPLFTSGQNGPNAHMRELFALLEAGGADVVINAHDHLYERFSQPDRGRPAVGATVSASSSSAPAARTSTASSRPRPIQKRGLPSSASCGFPCSPPPIDGSSCSPREGSPTRAGQLPLAFNRQSAILPPALP